jgi:transposase
MHYFLGCDVAKLKIDVSLVDNNGVELLTEKVANDTPAITTLLTTLANQYLDDELTVVTESTGVYHLDLANTACQLGFKCIVFNPILTKQQTKASIRGKKTDKTDATMIARIGLRGEGSPFTPDRYPATKYYARSAQKLSVLSSAFRRHHEHTASQLDEHLSGEAAELLLGILKSIDDAKKQLYQDMAISAQGTTFDLLQTISGIGPYVAASLIGEIQDMGRFKTAKSLVAYSGLDPKIRQSGHTLNSTGRLTKRGSTYLRRSIFIAANVARQHDEYFKSLYDKKRAEGKSYKVAICVVARKLLAIIRAVWLSGKSYDTNLKTQNSQNT